MKQNTKTAAECLDILEELEGVKISPQAFRQSMARAGVKPAKGGHWNVPEVLAARKASKASGSKAGGSADLRNEKLRLECAKLQAAIDAMTGKTMPVALACEQAAAVATETRQRLEMIPGSVAPLLVGKLVHEIAEILGREIRQALEGLSGEIIQPDAEG